MDASLLSQYNVPVTKWFRHAALRRWLSYEPETRAIYEAQVARFGESSLLTSGATVEAVNAAAEDLDEVTSIEPLPDGWMPVDHNVSVKYWTLTLPDHMPDTTYLDDPKWRQNWVRFRATFAARLYAQMYVYGLLVEQQDLKQVGTGGKGGLCVPAEE